MKNSIQKKTLLNRALSVIMTLVIVFSPMLAAHAVENGESIDEAYAFNQDTIRNFIDLHLEQQFVDEEFYHAIAQAYQASPSTFAELISDYSSEEILYLAKGIAYDLQKTGASVPRNSNSASATLAAIQSVIASGSVSLNDVCQTGFDLFDTEIPEPTMVQMPGQNDLQYTIIPQVGTMTYTSGNLNVGDPETLNVIFTQSNSTSTCTYWVEVYQRIGTSGSETLKASKSITFAPGVTSQSVFFGMTFYTTGSMYTIVKVYNTQGGSMLNSKVSPSPTPVYGEWEIIITLPVDRSQQGDLYLYRASGTVVLYAACLGKSAHNLPMSQTNGDTPTGVYSGYLAGPHSDTEAYGPYKYVYMEGVSGKIAEYSYRYDILIHGGRDNGDGVLVPTSGCVRVTNAKQQAIQNAINNLVNNNYHFTTGRIEILES